MPEPTLSLSLNDLNSEVGHFLGYGRGSVIYADPTWTQPQLDDINSCVRSGLRQFYYPPPIEGMESAYDWSFLKPILTMQLDSGKNLIQLPDDFAAFEGQLTLFPNPQGLIWWPIRIVNEGTVREQYAALPIATGRPLMCAVQPLKGTSGTQGQRFQLFFYPNSDANYTLQGAYYILPDYLTAALPFTYGGGHHTETILESCLAVAEERLDDAQTVHKQKFNERMLASISADRRSKAQMLGYNGDRSDQRHFDWRKDLHGWSPVAVNGTVY